MPERILVVVCDGLGDRPVSGFGNRTPLQAAARPALNFLARNGACGILDIIAPGVRPGSDTAHLALFGHDPFKVYTGRGPFEAMGVGMEVRPGDVAFRCNFSTVDDRLNIVDRRAGRIREGTAELARALDGWEFEGVEVHFKEGTEHRGVLLLRAPGLSSLVSDPDPHQEGVRPHECEPKAPEAALTARVVNAFVKRSTEVLRDHPVNRARRRAGERPANIVLPRGAGIMPHIPTFRERFGMKCAAIAGVALVKGICRVSGMEVIDVKGATGGLDTDIEAKLRAALKALESNDLVFVNIKAADLCGHDGDPNGKVKVAKRIDRAMSLVKKALPEGAILALTSDHSTPCCVKDHTGDPVPLVIYGKGVRADRVRTFDEIACAEGGLGRLRGVDLLPVLMDLAGRAEKFGA
ncbi:MAG: 2,3-bisphosphoglycerate-independent phosphoglycerate mutase [Euryarchaeota archaeon]|nr:2,3-bisphosphoglycerate-independent phosphoglycerate mutase [Euryarchaeota archaeon]